MNWKKISILLSLLLVAALFLGLCACGTIANNDQTEEKSQNTQESNAPTEITPATTEETTSDAPEETIPEISVKVPIDIETIGGVVIVGTVGFDDAGWHIIPEQPLNITYEYFLDNPSVFPEQTRIRMLDPKDDGMDKSVYLGHTVTVHGEFRFVRDDFETLYLCPFTITMGKIVEESYGDSELKAPEGPVDLYDRSVPLPNYMEPLISDGKYIYNAFMLSEESLQLLGNDFALFYCDFVDAVLNYRSEVPCPERAYAEMLGSVIYYDFPIFDACAEPFEFFKHYDSEANTISIAYKYGEDEHQKLLAQFQKAADEMLATVTPDMSDVEKAKNIRGTKFIHIIAPCPTGWGISTDKTIEIARDVVESGLWYLAEYQDGKFTLNYKPKEFTPVADYLKKQTRFRHLTDEDISVIEQSRDKKWKTLETWV